MKINRTKCIWAACIAAFAVCITLTTAVAVGPPPSPCGSHGNLGCAYISNVTSGANCVASTIDGGNQFWDIQFGGTYTITLSNVIDCANGGLDPNIELIIQNSEGGNIVIPSLSTTQLDDGVYKFTVTLQNQCNTMIIKYCTVNGDESTGLQARDALQGDTGPGHLRTSDFDSSCAVTAYGTCNPPPPPCPGSNITACKYYDTDAAKTGATGKPPLANWPFCLTKVNDLSFAAVTQPTGSSGCTTFANLPLGDYILTEGTAGGTWVNSTNSMEILIDHCGTTVTRSFGNFCTQPSGGLTLGFWSNKNGNKILTGSSAGNGTTLTTTAVNALNSCAFMRNANGSLHPFTTSYSAFKTWLLGANATNMAYMLSAQLAALRLDVTYGDVDGNAYDLCSGSTVNTLMQTACDQLQMDGNTVSGNPTRPAQEMLKNCIDAINNGGPVIPVQPCDYSGASAACGE